MTMQELCKKDVVQVSTGTKLGRVDDLEFEGAVIGRMILRGRPRLFGLLGREPDVEIPWSEVERIGRDVILVSTQLELSGGPDRGGFLRRFFMEA